MHFARTAIGDQGTQRKIRSCCALSRSARLQWKESWGFKVARVGSRTHACNVCQDNTPRRTQDVWFALASKRSQTTGERDVETPKDTAVGRTPRTQRQAGRESRWAQQARSWGGWGMGGKEGTESHRPALCTILYRRCHHTCHSGQCHSVTIGRGPCACSSVRRTTASPTASLLRRPPDTRLLRIHKMKDLGRLWGSVI